MIVWSITDDEAGVTWLSWKLILTAARRARLILAALLAATI